MELFGLDSLGGIESITMMQIIMRLLVTFVLSLVVAWVYRKTHKGLSYSQSLVFTMVIISMLIAMTMMVVGNSLARAFALLGAFTIIRFRTVVKDTKDTSFIFFSLVIGMAVGTGNYEIGILATIVISIIIWMLWKIDFGSMRRHDYLVSFYLDTTQSATKDHTELFKDYLKDSLLVNMNSHKNGAVFEFIYNIKLRDMKKLHDFTKELSSIPGIDRVSIINSRDDLEY